MSNESNSRRGQHCIFNLRVHLILIAKYRRRVFDAPAINVLRDIFARVCTLGRATLVEIDGKDDHVHLQGYTPRACSDPG
jgi:putative transposase